MLKNVQLYYIFYLQSVPNIVLYATMKLNVMSVHKDISLLRMENAKVNI